MPTWQIALTGLVAAWSLQGFGTYWQVRHYGAAMGEITGTWTDGFVGTGIARSTLGAGLMLLLVVDSDRVVRRLLVMRGRSVFARFNAAHRGRGPVTRRVARRPAVSQGRPSGRPGDGHRTDREGSHEGAPRFGTAGESRVGLNGSKTHRKGGEHHGVDDDGGPCGRLVGAWHDVRLPA